MIGHVDLGDAVTTMESPEDRSDTLSASASRYNAPRVSLLVCTLGRGEQLVRLLASLTVQTLQNFEVVLVDQNAPGTLDAILDPFRGRLTITHVQSLPGLSRARNVGLSRCVAPLIGFPDDDCWYPAGLVGDIVGAFEADPGLAALTGRTIDGGGRESLGSFLKADARIDRRNVWFAGNSNSLFVRREAALAIAGFDESLGVGCGTGFESGEETDFLLRIVARGGVARYRCDLSVHHDQVVGVASATLEHRARTYSRGFGRVLRLHRYGIAYLGLRVSRTLVATCIAAARRDRGGARYKALWAWGTACGYADRTPAVLHGPVVPLSP